LDTTSSNENLVPIPSEFEGISDDTSDVPTCDDNRVNVESDLVESLINHDTSIVHPSKIDPILEEFAGELAHIAPIPPGIVEADFDPNDDTSSDDDSFENIKYVDASPSYSELDSLEEVNDVDQEEKEFNLEDIFQIQDIILREKLLNVHRLISNIESLKVNPTPDRVLKSHSSFPILVVDSDAFFEEFDTSLSHLDNSLPEFETFSDHTEETRSGSTTTHANYSLPEYRYMKNHMKTVKNGQTRTQERKSEQKPEAKARKSVLYPRINPLLQEFAGELSLINPIPPGIAGADSDPEGDICLVEKLLNDNLSHRTPDELNSEDIIEFFSAFPIPVEDSDSLLEETNTILSYLDDSLPELETFSFDYYSFHFDLSDTSLHLADKSDSVFEKINDELAHIILPPDDPLSPVLETLLPFSSDIEDKVFNPRILVKEEKSPHLLSHQGFKVFKIIINFLMNRR
ncbi:hypothetical protein Tco_1576674, partial [Tanacetum coccineum]